MHSRLEIAQATVHYQKTFVESQHPRDHGKFAEKTVESQPTVESMAQAASEKGWSVKVMRQKAMAAGLDPNAVRAAAAKISQAGGRKQYQGPQKPKWEAQESRHEIADPEVIAKNYDHAHSKLSEIGAKFIKQSPSGSRYYDLNGQPIRVSDHAPNEATNQWAEKSGAAEIRVDRTGFDRQLSDLIGI